MELDLAINEVSDWNAAFGHIDDDPIKDAQKWPERKGLATDLVVEEVNELLVAVRDDDKVEMLDAVCDILVTVFGLAAKAGIHQYIVPAFEEVMSSNWSKLDENGDPVYYENGKIGKSDLYFPPELAQIIEGVDKGEL